MAYAQKIPKVKEKAFPKWYKEIEEENFVGYAKGRKETVSIKRVKNYSNPNQIWAVSHNGVVRITFSKKETAERWAKEYLKHY